MARMKKTPFPPWQTKKPNGIEERYIRLGNSQLLSNAVLTLNPAAFRVYVYMLLESGGKPVFEFPRSKFIRIISQGGFQKAVKELTAAGFIELEEQNANIRKPNLYRFSDKWRAF